MVEKIKQALDFIREKGIRKPEIGIVLGTGLGKLVNDIKIHHTIDYTDIPHFPVSTVESHSGRLVYGRLRNKCVIAMQGRFHFYEGYSLQQITFPIRVMKMLGIKYLLLSNACGAMNLNFKKGSLMLINDHINLLSSSPLIGRNDETMGPRFPDMSKAYSTEMNSTMHLVAKDLKIELNEGVYVAVPGPNLETPAEYRFLNRIGADVVGMSTVPEVIVANHMGLPCAAISVITDECDPDNLHPVDIKEIIKIAGQAEEKLTKLISGFVENYHFE
jgi:purine-nucleoside phosphorylase